MNDYIEMEVEVVELEEEATPLEGQLADAVKTVMRLLRELREEIREIQEGTTREGEPDGKK